MRSSTVFERGFEGVEYGREKRIRTSGPCLPKAVLYQAELFPDRWYSAFRQAT
jgi:hypothetical protein